MPRTVLLFLAVVGFLGLVLAGSRLYAERKAASLAEAATVAFEERLTLALDAALAEQGEAAEVLARRLRRVDDLKTAQELRLRRYRGASHLQAARRLGVRRVSGAADIERLVAEGQLVPLGDTPYYYVQDLDYSTAYVTPDLARLLEAIGERFHARLRAHGLPLYRYCISSVLRTAENQRALRLINPNAARGVSAHEFGTTLDVVIHKYAYLDRPEDRLPPSPYASLNGRLEALRVERFGALGYRYWQELQGILGRVLIELQDEGKALVLLEREQPVFHLTVAEPLAAEAPPTSDEGVKN